MTIFYAVATKETDGNWFPWLDVCASSRNGVLMKWRIRYKTLLVETSDRRIMRFYATTKARAKR